VNTERQRTGGRKYPPSPGSFEEWLQGQVDQEDAAGAVARFVLEDREHGCWVDAFDHDYFMMRKEAMRRGVVRQVILEHNLSGNLCVVLERLHREYEGVDARRIEQLCESMKDVDRWTF
jgi:hypothetical protein